MGQLKKREVSLELHALSKHNIIRIPLEKMQELLQEMKEKIEINQGNFFSYHHSQTNESDQRECNTDREYIYKRLIKPEFFTQLHRLQELAGLLGTIPTIQNPLPDLSQFTGSSSKSSGHFCHKQCWNLTHCHGFPRGRSGRMASGEGEQPNCQTVIRSQTQLGGIL